MSIFDMTAEEDGTAQQATAPALRRIPRGTDQQELLWDELCEGDTHVLVEARAGSGKSSSCREGMWRMLDRHPSWRLRYSVYNKANADEFRGSCPPGVDVGTSHAFGYAALRGASQSRVEKNKTYLILDETREGRNLPRYLRKSVATLVGQAKNHALDPEEDNGKELNRLALHYDVRAYGRPGVLTDFAAAVLERSAEWSEVVDFDDMIWLPGLLGLSFPACDALFLDEVQDWNPAQHKLIPLMARSGRVIAVGDRYQAINIFRGADAESMTRLANHLGFSERKMTLAPLTITFRCPWSHVRLVREYVSDIFPHESAPEGEIARGLAVAEMLQTIRPGDLAICPTNAPVVSAALKLIGLKRPAFVRGRAVGDQLITVLGTLPACRTVGDMAKGVEDWRGKELSRLSALDGVDDVIESVCDRADGLQAILSACSLPSEVQPLIFQLFSDDKGREGAVTFSTVHRAKGDEAGHVYLIDAPGRAPKQPWEETQAQNLRYVSLTRSKLRLSFVQPEERTEK